MTHRSTPFTTLVGRVFLTMIALAFAVVAVDAVNLSVSALAAGIVLMVAIAALLAAAVRLIWTH